MLLCSPVYTSLSLSVNIIQARLWTGGAFSMTSIGIRGTLLEIIMTKHVHIIYIIILYYIIDILSI